MKERLYFAYGANLNCDAMSRRCPAAIPVESLYLQGWRLAFDGVATVIRDTHSQVAGALWQITQDCEVALDTYEGYPWMYHKQYLYQDNKSFMIYVLNQFNPNPPGDSYLRTIRQGYQDWHLPVSKLTQAVDDSCVFGTYQ